MCEYIFVLQYNEYDFYINQLGVVKMYGGQRDREWVEMENRKCNVMFIV